MIRLLAPSDVVGFWKAAGPPRWYKKSDTFDAEVREALGEMHLEAARRELDGWMETAEGALGLLILLDQVPRNIFRGTAHQFATDALARVFCRDGIARGYPGVRA